MRKNQKGFLIALCLCMLSVSGIFGVYQYRKGLSSEPGTEVPRQNAQVEEQKEPEREAANSRGTVAQADTEEKEAGQAKIDTEEDIYKIGEAELAQTGGASEEETIAEDETQETEPSEEKTEEEESVETNGQADRLSFSDSSKILWPVEGDVILDYSMDKSIYFSTLNQYKYHPAIVISADVGSEVQCAAKGRVSEIKVNEETGTTVFMELGDSYEAVYGQLKEVMIEEGDIVEEGRLIGYVSEPTKYYTLEGSNLYFQLLKKNKPVDPMGYIE